MKQTIIKLLLAGLAPMYNLYGQCTIPSSPSLGDNCSLAPLVCGTLDGYCGTLGNNNVVQPFPGCPNWVLNNDGWLRFIAGSTSITIQIVPSNCTGGIQQGMQGGIYGGCVNQIMDLQCPCSLDPFQLSANNFVVGQQYYLVLDGCAGDICDFEITLLAGTTLPVLPGPISGDTLVCPGSLTSYSVPNNPAATYTWSITPASIGNIVGTNPNSAISVEWTDTGEAQLCVSTADPGTCPNAVKCLSIHSELIPSTDQFYEICADECATCAGVVFCAQSPPGGHPVVLNSWQGCDSVIICHVDVIAPIATDLGQIVLCAPDSYSVCGNLYSQSGNFTAGCTNWQGCDSTVNFDLAILEPVANVAGNAGTLGCGVHSVLLDGSGSSINPFQNGTTEYLWTGPPGIIGPNNGSSVEVNMPGQFCLTLTHTLSGISCTDIACTVVEINNTEPVISWTGTVDFWNIYFLWDLGYVPEPCNHVLVPGGSSTVPIGYEGVGRTLYVQLGAELEVPNGAMLDIH